MTQGRTGSGREQLPVEAYQRAESMLGHRRSRLTLRARVQPHWIEGGDGFWYRVDTERGTEFVVAYPERGERRPAFDHDRLAAALAAASGEAVEPFALPFATIELDPDRIAFGAFGSRWSCDLAGYGCERVGEFDVTELLEVPSPDGRWLAFRRGEDVWIRPAGGGEERRLTDDGGESRRYATVPEGLYYTQLLNRYGVAETPPSLSWSPDSRRILTHRIDETGVEIMSLVESAPGDGSRPRLWQSRYPVPGEPLPQGQWVVLDLEGETVEAADEPFPMPAVPPNDLGWTWWSQDGEKVFYLEQPRDRLTLRLEVLDAITGEVETLLEESGETRVEPMQEWGQPPLVAILGDGEEALWYSQRDGWGHLYLYDLRSGSVRNQVTRGDFVVRQILHVDEEQRVAHLQVSGLIAADPYRRSLVSVGLDGGELRLLDDDELDHALSAPAHGRWFLDSASTVSEPPVTTVRDREGAVLLELERADVTRLREAGWTPPERFRTLAADGETEIYGVLHKPFGFDPGRSYPVLDNPYPGPQVCRVLPSFEQFPPFGPEAEAMAALGFVVVAVDGRGTPGRSKAFHDHSYGNLGGCGALEDHVAALEQLAAERPWMDLERVGIFGVSGGGFATVRAMLSFPATYRVGVAEAGNHDNRIYHAEWAETYDGPFDPDAGARLSNTELADNLEGRLFLIHGALDDNVSPDQTMRLVDRLIAANKDFELLLAPGAEHTFAGYQPYVKRRRWDFLVRNLLDLEPPQYRIADIPLDPLTPELLASIKVFGG